MEDKSARRAEALGSRVQNLEPTKVLARLEKAAAQSRTEEDLRIRFEHVLKETLPGLPEPRYEQSVRTATYTGRADAVHTRLVIEYEPPRKLKGQGGVVHAVGQVCDYMTGLALGGRPAEGPLSREDEEALSRVVGIATDGTRFVFAQRRARGWHQSPSVLNEATVEKLLLWFRATARKDLSSANLIRDFGPDTPLASSVVKLLAETVASKRSAKASVVYDEWQRIFGIVYGTEQLSRTGKTHEARTIRDAYHLALKAVDFPTLLFSIHTYYALLMKMLATELIVAQGGFADSFIGNLTQSTLRDRLSELESGEILQSRGIRNAIEQDFFGWYTSAWSPELRQALWPLVEALRDYDIATFELKPDRARDLLKDLYHGLVPEAVRHALGEYYTPDWLAEHTIALAGYDGHPKRTFLDPSCGSGTFLVFAIQKVRTWLNDHSPEWSTSEKRREALALIQRNIVGFDLNPVAVIASRTNYLFALGPLLRYHNPGASQLEIPVYMTDSVLLPGQMREQRDMFAKDTVAFPMTVGTFEIPREVVERAQVPQLMALLHEAVVEKHKPEAFVRRSVRELGLAADDDTAVALTGLCNAMSKLDREGKNRIWTKLIRNRYAALFFRSHFDFVVGNPPHVNWEYLTPEWRKAAEGEYQRYGLFTLAGLESRHGGGKKDIAVLFTYAVIDHFLKDAGVLALVLHVSLLKASGAGEGFRRFQLGAKTPFGVEEVHDFSRFQPFLTHPGMHIKTRTITLRAVKGKTTKYPVRYQSWTKTERGIVPGHLSWDDARERLACEEREAVPLRGEVGQGRLSPWLTVSRKERKALARVIASPTYKPHYQAHAGFTTWLNGVFFLNVLERNPDGTLLIENRHDVGKNVCPKVRTVIEERFVHPLVRGRGVARWRAETDGHVLLVQDPKTQRGIDPEDLQADSPQTWAYLRRFEKLLRARKGFQKFYDTEKDPFYSMYNVGAWTMAKHKVVWMDVSETMKASVLSHGGRGNMPLPEHKLMLVAAQSADEAHYLAAVLNSGPVTRVIESYIVDNSVSTHPVENIVIPRFDAGIGLHRQLSDLSREAHEATRAEEAESVDRATGTIDAVIPALWKDAPPDRSTA